MWKYNTLCKNVSAKKLNEAADKSSPVAMMGSYVNAVKGKKQNSSKNDPQPGDLIVVQCYAGESMSYMKVLIDSGNQLSTISEDALKRTGKIKIFCHLEISDSIFLVQRPIFSHQF